MDYFQMRKNSRQVVRIYRGPYEGLDITRLQIWYRSSDDDEYKPGRVVAFASDLIPGVIEGLIRMAKQAPEVDTATAVDPAPELAQAVRRVLRSHKRALHWENLATIVLQEHPALRASRWTVYNVLLSHPELFEQIEDDVFLAR